jgi:hypothetical protein
MLWVCIEPERREKTLRILGSFAQGWGEHVKLCEGMPPDDGNPFIVWGQKWTALEAIPKAIAQNRPFWQLDNGYWMSGGGRNVGYYRISYRGLQPVFLKDAPPRAEAIGVKMAPWRKDGEHIVFALPGEGYGRAVGLDMKSWVRETQDRLRDLTKRPIVVRPKDSTTPLAHDLRNAWALVTHSSNVAVDAVLAGVPVFVAGTSPAAPVGRTEFDFENPVMPERKDWLNSLMCQQFTLPEMQRGTAFHYLSKVREMVDQ